MALGDLENEGDLRRFLRSELSLELGKLAELSGLIKIGSGDPNGKITASPPAIFLSRAGGAATTFWKKESGVQTNTGWVGV